MRFPGQTPFVRTPRPILLPSQAPGWVLETAVTLSATGRRPSEELPAPSEVAAGKLCWHFYSGPRKNGGPGVQALWPRPALWAESHPRPTPGASLVTFVRTKAQLLRGQKFTRLSGRVPTTLKSSAGARTGDLCPSGFGATPPPSSKLITKYRISSMAWSCAPPGRGRAGAPVSSCSAEVNSACAKVLPPAKAAMGKTLVRRKRRPALRAGKEHAHAKTFLSPRWWRRCRRPPPPNSSRSTESHPWRGRAPSSPCPPPPGCPSCTGRTPAPPRRTPGR